ncbi:MAG: hypothetical protein R8N24_03075 [Alphaproteobacteria bacterium]|nr:hypothetical protein [Alphaproteobacteria bacterium]
MRLFVFLILIFTSSASAASVASVRYVDECVATKVSKLEGSENEMAGTYNVVVGKGHMNVPTPDFPEMTEIR